MNLLKLLLLVFGTFIFGVVADIKPEMKSYVVTFNRDVPKNVLDSAMAQIIENNGRVVHIYRTVIKYVFVFLFFFYLFLFYFIFFGQYIIFNLHF